MNSRLGIELGAHTIRGVRLEGWPRRRVRFAEVAWDSDNLQGAVDSLLQHLGSAQRLGVALDLSLLFVKQVKLPPLPAADKANIVRVEPERFFPVRLDDLVPVARDEDDLVFAARETPYTAWVTALEQLGPIDRVEPGPVALTRALARARIQHGTVLTGDGAVVEIRQGRVLRARRVFGDVTDAAAAIDATDSGSVYLEPWDDARATVLRALLPAATVEPLPQPAAPDLPSRFLPAFGAALGIGEANREVLHSADIATRIMSRRRRDGALAAIVCAAALLFAVISADGWRARTKRELGAALQTLNARTAPALALQTQLTTLQRQSDAIARVASERGDPLEVLLALSQRLPRDVYLRAISASGAEWRLEGFAPNAARMLGLLDATPAFHDVRFLSATNRAVIGTRTYESFSLAFRYTPTP